MSHYLSQSKRAQLDNLLWTVFTILMLFFLGGMVFIVKHVALYCSVHAC